MRPTLIALCMLASFEAHAVPTHRGFPVYPPRGISSIRGRSTFNLKAGGERALEAAIPYLERHTKALGWILLHDDFYLDGGSPAQTYGKLIGGRLLVVDVSVFSGNADDSDWGKILYRFVSAPRPAVRARFPLCPLRAGAPPIQETTSAEGVELHAECDWRGIHDFAAQSLPFLYGWRPVKAAGGLWVRADIVADPDHVRGQLRVRIFNARRSKELLDHYRIPARKSARVESGCLVFHGRLIRRPYRLELVDGKILVNDLVIRDVKNRHKEGQLSDFDHQVKMFQGHQILVMGAWGTFSGMRPSEAVVQDFVAGVERALAGGRTIEEKVARLARVKSLGTLGTAALAEIAKNWSTPATKPR